MKKKQVSIIVGSDSDLPVVQSATKTLDEFGISYSLNVASAHRTPEYVKRCIHEAERNGVKIFIAAAGMSAALPGVVASETILPVIGIPIEGKSLSGMDAILSIVQMPPGIPVATVALGKSGATNAAIVAAEILSLNEPALKKKLVAFRKKLADTVIRKDEMLNKSGIEKYISESQKKG